jgi:hypothetical protein
MGEMRNAYDLLFRRFEKKDKALGKPKRKWEN